MSRRRDVPIVVLVGGRGFGAHHLERLRQREASGAIRLAAIADPALASETGMLDGTPVVPRLEDTLAHTSPDVVIIATPIGTHATLCETALRHGADVYLEKPPVATLADFERLLAVQRETGGVVQVGFQSLGSHALGALKDPALGIGTIASVSATGLWSRPLEYWKRARWAGRRVLDGTAVVDGVATNPLAHAVATALHVAGLTTVDDIVTVETELYRANAIDSDDTSVVRVAGRSGPPVTCALTLCAPPPQTRDRGAVVTVQGAQNTAEFAYTTDVLAAGNRTLTFDRTDLLDNLLAHRTGDAALVAPLEQTGAFMRVLEAIRTAPEPTKIDPQFVDWSGDGDKAYPVVRGIAEIVRRAATSGRTFSEVGAPWAHAARDSILATLSVDGDEVADYRDGAATIAFSSPRPYLHPVRTRSGVVVSAHHPADHDWHLGLGFAVQDADGVNFWGGRTYIPERGYIRRDDHGRIDGGELATSDGAFSQSLTWRAPHGRTVLTQNLAVAARATGTSWILDLESELTSPGADDVVLESPGSKGRAGAGYGGLFWRLPACRDARVFTSDFEGEDAVNGTRAPWIAWSAEFLAGPGMSGPATLVLCALDEHPDPWFVRLEQYPGFGTGVAWDTRTVVSADRGLRRRFRAFIVDGIVPRDDIEQIITGGTS